MKKYVKASSSTKQWWKKYYKCVDTEKMNSDLGLSEEDDWIHEVQDNGYEVVDRVCYLVPKAKYRERLEESGLDMLDLFEFEDGRVVPCLYASDSLYSYDDEDSFLSETGLDEEEY